MGRRRNKNAKNNANKKQEAKQRGGGSSPKNVVTIEDPKDGSTANQGGQNNSQSPARSEGNGNKTVSFSPKKPASRSPSPKPKPPKVARKEVNQSINPGKVDMKHREMLGKHVATQPEVKELLQAGIMQPQGGRRLSASLQVPARQLQRRLSAGSLQKALDERPVADDAVVKRVTFNDDNRVAPALRGPRAALARRMSSDVVGHLLDTRPDASELEHAGLLKACGVAPALQAGCLALQRVMHRDSLSYLLSSRPPPEDIAQTGILPLAPWWRSGGHDEQAGLGAVAASIQMRRRSLERELTKNKLSSRLQQRSEPAELRDANILPHDVVDDSLQPGRCALQLQMRRQSLDRSLGRRPSLEDVAGAGIYLARARSRSRSPKKKAQPSPRLAPTAASPSSSPAFKRRRAELALALEATHELKQAGLLSQAQRTALKNLILLDDARVSSAVEVYDMDQDYDELLDTLYRLAVVAVSNVGAR